MNAKVCVYGNVMRQNPASDHIPVALSLECPRLVATPSKAIPRWIARHPMFETALEELLRQCDATDPYEKLADFKEAVTSAKLLFYADALCTKPRQSRKRSTGQLLYIVLLDRVTRLE
eukprot:12775905-Heterocapsa_arctica.AAC.1